MINIRKPLLAAPARNRIATDARIEVPDRGARGRDGSGRGGPGFLDRLGQRWHCLLESHRKCVNVHTRRFKTFGGDLSLKKPKRPANRLKCKPKALWSTPDPDRLSRAANSATYSASPYHCQQEKGARRASRMKPASPCPRFWSAKEALQTLKRAIRFGYVSQKWIGDFPQYVWYREGEHTIYEARSEPRTPHRFHAYPIESSQVPRALQW